MRFFPRGVVIVLSTLVVAAVLAFWFAPFLVANIAEYWVRSHAGRSLTIEHARVKWGQDIVLVLSGLALANASWSKQPVMAKVNRVTLHLPASRLLRGHLAVSRADVRGVDLLLERRNGRTNWSLPGEGKTAPLAVGEFHLQDLHVRYHDPDRESDIVGTLSTFEADETDDRRRIRGAGVLDGKPLEFTGTLLAAEKEGWLRFAFKLGDTRLDVDGPHAGRYAAHFWGEDLGRAFPLIPIPFPSTPAYDLKANISRSGTAVRVRDLRGRLGQSDLGGELTLDITRNPVAMRGTLHSESLYLGDMKGFLGLPVHGPSPRPGKIFPNTPINVNRFHRVDLTLDYDASTLHGTRLPLESWKGRVRIAKGVLTIEPLDIAVARGDAKGDVFLDVRREPVAGSLMFRLHRVRLGMLVKRMAMLDASRGAITGEADLSGQGQSLADIFATSHGRVFLLMTHGRLERAFIDAAGGEIARLLSGQKEEPVPIRCAVSVFDVNGGIARADAFAIDTDPALITGRGTIDLRNEQLDLSFIATPKQPSLSAPSPVRVRGSFSNPKVSLDTSRLESHGLAALALGALLGPLAALPALIRPGTSEESDCGDLVKQFRENK